MPVKLAARTPVQRHPGYVQLNVGIPSALDRAVRQYARAHGVYLNSIVILALCDWLEREPETPAR